MEITEVRVKLAPPDIPGRSAKLKAFATVTFDNSFVVRDIKVILGARGLFVAMPSRRLEAPCPRCHCKNHLRAGYCNECGTKLSSKANQLDHRGRAKLHADVAHPINRSCRGLLQKAIVEAYHEEIEKSRQAGYEPAAYEFPEAAECYESTPPGPEETEPEDTGAENVEVEDAEQNGGAPEGAGEAAGSSEEAGESPDEGESDDEREPDDGDSEADADLGIFG